MKRMFAVMLAMFGLMSGCSCHQVNPGQVGVKIVSWGTDKGVDNQTYGIGVYTLGPSESMEDFPVSEQTYTWTKAPSEGDPVDESFTFQTREGLSVNADLGITYHVDETKVINVYQKYRMDMAGIRHTFLHNAVRDSLNMTASTMPIESVYGEGKAKLLGDALKRIQEQMSPNGIVVDQLAIVGDFRLPQQVTDALNSKITATQKAQQIENEVKQTQAEAQKAVAKATGEAQAAQASADGESKAALVRAKAQAESNLMLATAQAQSNQTLAKSLTPELLQYTLYQKWSGQLPQITTGDKMVPLLNLGTVSGK